MNRLIVRALLLSIVEICYSLVGVAQHEIRGRILDEQNRGLDAAVVMLISMPKQVLVETTLTDGNGQFSLPPREGDYLLCVRTLGYKEFRKSIKLFVGGDALEIQLKPEELNLKEAVITARRSSPMTSAEKGKIQIRVAQSYLADLGNALEVLKHSPGILVNDKGGVSLSSLGGTAVYVNGRKLMLEGEELAAYLRSLPASKIARIETSPSPNASFAADGAGGIINIILKTRASAGFFLSTSHSLAYWTNLVQASDLALSYNTQKWQLALNYSHTIGHHAMNYGYEKLQNGDKSISETADTDKRNTYSLGAEFAWLWSDKSKLFLNSSFSLLAGPGETETTSLIYHGLNDLQQILKARNHYIEQKNFRYNNNLNYLYQPSEGRKLSVSFDWTKFNGKARCEQPNDYYSPQKQLLYSDQFYSQPEKNIDILALLLDHQYTLDERNELLLGAKASLIKSDNTFLFKKNGALDPNRSNRFFYNEKNLEAYVQYRHSFGNLEMSAGLRVEYMATSNKLRAYTKAGEERDRSAHCRLFPNLSLFYALNEEHKLSLLYSRRQDKPRYEDLNPFEYLLDEFSYWKGNPFLKPQISNKVMLNYVWRSLSVNLSYNKLDDYFTSLTDVFEHNKTIMTIKNIGVQHQLGLEMIYSKGLTSWWDFSANLGVYYFVNQLDYKAYKQVYRRPSCFFAVSNSILLPFGFNLELSGRYYSKRQGGSYEVNKSTGGIDLGINKSWCDGRMRLSFLMTDLLHTERWDSYGSKDALHLSSWGYGESRKAILRWSYSFGKQKFDREKQHVEEVNRL